MEVTIELRAPLTSEEARDQFSDNVRTIAAIYGELAEIEALPKPKVTVVLADDLPAEVTAYSPAVAEEMGTTERIGGVVAGKNIPLRNDHSEVVVIIDSRTWREEDPHGLVHLLNFFLVAHELAHPLLSHAAHLAGVYEGVVFPSQTGTEITRSLTRVLFEEFRADVLADTVLRQRFSVDVAGIDLRVGQWELLGTDFVDGLKAVLTDSYPTWPDRVETYRLGDIDLDRMWGEIAPPVAQTLTLLMHAEAAYQQADGSTLTGPSLASIIDLPELANLPALDLYLREGWSMFLPALFRHRVLHPVNEILDVYKDVTKVGEASVRLIFRSLGLELEDRPNRGLYLRVTDPQRLAGS